MELIGSKHDIDFLKCVLACNFFENDVRVVIATEKSSPRLLMKDREIMLMGHSILSHLQPSSEFDAQINYWLDFDNLVLRNLVESHLSKKPGCEIGESWKNDLEETLQTHSFLVSNEITVADLAIMCTLRLVIHDRQFLAKFELQKLLLWYQKVANLTKEIFSISLVQAAFAYESGTEACDDELAADVGNPDRRFFVPPRTDRKQPQSFPVLPIPGERNILITSALPYVNNVPHLGNLIGCVLSADVFARYCRARGHNVLYISGTDEYGTATETKALQEGTTPQQICDKFYKLHATTYAWFDISFDYFGRTTCPAQTETCQSLFLELKENNLISTDMVDQLLCTKCDRCLADRFVEGVCPKCLFENARGDQCDGCGHLINATELINPKCKMCQTAPVPVKSEQFFIDLPKIEPMLRDWLGKSSPGWSNIAKKIAYAWIADGLKPRCITRDLKWGIPVPIEKYKEKVFYVWFDAPLGYISMTKNYTAEWEKWWFPSEAAPVHYYQFMAKDNVAFHSIMFPATLLGTGRGYNMVDHIFATEYLNYESGKFSKSRGVGVFATDARDTGITADIWRFYLCYVRPESQDSSFSWEDFASKTNKELLNNLGNFLYRTLTFAAKYYDSTVPKIDLNSDDLELIDGVNDLLHKYLQYMEAGRLREGIRFTLAITRLGNQYFQKSEPWRLNAQPETQTRAQSVIGLCCHLSALIGTLLMPYMPTTAKTLFKQLSLGPSKRIIADKFQPNFFKLDHRMCKPAPLFKEIDPATVSFLTTKFSGPECYNATCNVPTYAPGSAKARKNK